MVFQELDKWMLDIEEKANPTAKERRLHMKLGSIRNNTYLRYSKVFDKALYRNQRPAPIHCRERAMPLFMRKTFHICEEFKKAFGGDI
jgi:hypothetical protein